MTHNSLTRIVNEVLGRALPLLILVGGCVHDLVKNILNSLKVQVLKVEVTDLKNSTFYALVHLAMGGKTFKIDARPSDAIAIALRTSAQIYVDEEVIKKLKSINLESIKNVDKIDKSAEWKDLLEEMSPEDFGKYKM